MYKCKGEDCYWCRVSPYHRMRIELSAWLRETYGMENPDKLAYDALHWAYLYQSVYKIWKTPFGKEVVAKANELKAARFEGV